MRRKAELISFALGLLAIACTLALLRNTSTGDDGTHPTRTAGGPEASGSLKNKGGSIANPSLPGAALIAQDRLTQWNPGLLSRGGIPQRTRICASLAASDFGDGGKNASQAIQAAIDACPDDEVVQLSAGTFLVNDLLSIRKGITLRGAGAGKTFVKKTNGAKPLKYAAEDAQPFVVIGPNRWPKPDTSSQDLRADAPKGATAVTVVDASGFGAGQFVLLDELSGARWMNDPLGRGQVWAAPDWRVVWSLRKPAAQGDDPLEASTPTGGEAAGWFARRDRVTSELKEIANVNGNVVTFTSPLHISYRASHKAQLTGYANNPVVSRAGVENLTVSGYSDGAIRFEVAAYSWAKNVEVTQWLGEGVAFDNSFRCELRDSYIHDGAWPQPGGGGYAISLGSGSAEILIENNIALMSNKLMVARSAGAGSVVGYNYIDDGIILTAEKWVEVGLNASHMAGPHHVLFEGNDAFNFDSDKTHGSATYHTVFRNWLHGFRKPFVSPETKHAIDDAKQSGNGPMRCAGAQAYSYWMTFVGNVLGEAGRMDGFVYDATGPGSFNKRAIWMLGWDDAAPQPYDPNVAATTVREGNWDWLQRKQSWTGGKAKPLPDSLYRTEKPAFFGKYAWPWVDPSSGKTATLPAKARFDAHTPNSVE